MIHRHRGETLTLAATANIDLAQTRNIPPGFNILEVEPIHASTVEVLLMALAPKIERILFYDASAPASSRWIDLTTNLLDRNVTTGAASGSGAYLNAMTTTDALYICFKKSVRGVGINVADLNTETSTATWSYLDTENAWTSLSATDGTDPTGGAVVTLGEDGLVTWTVPNAERWGSRLLPNFDTEPPSGVKDLRGYWVRMTVSATLTNPTSIVEIIPLANTNTNSLTARLGEPAIRLMTHNAARPVDRFNVEGYGGLEITSTSLTSDINLNWLEER